MATDTPAPPVPPAEDRYVAVEESPEFGALRKAYRGFVFPVTVAFLVWYGLYVLLSAYARGFMSHKLVGNINVALVFGLLQFVSTFLIAWAYTRFADQKLDPESTRLRDEIEGVRQ
jgi:uncharacterized membrane protein (DUF485 family)